MVTIPLSEVTIHDQKALDNLLRYMNRASQYPYFDKFQPVKVYVDSNKDFTAFESLRYNLQFYSCAHKLTDTINSTCHVVDGLVWDELHAFVMHTSCARV